VGSWVLLHTTCEHATTAPASTFFVRRARFVAVRQTRRLNETS
jgi:hypothetical protein